MLFSLQYATITLYIVLYFSKIPFMKRVFQTKTTMSIAILLATLAYSTAFSGYEEIECSSDSLFSQYGCHQCFMGTKVEEGQVITHFEDLWKNNTEQNQVLYKEEQKYPVLHMLNNAVFEQKPSNNASFWEYPTDLESYLDQKKEAYVLAPNQSVTWIRSTPEAAYKAVKLPPEGKNAALLVFELATHNETKEWQIDENLTIHKECVLFVSWKKEEVSQEPVIEEKDEEHITEVKAWPDSTLFLMILMLGMMGIMLVILKKRKIQ